MHGLTAISRGRRGGTSSIHVLAGEVVGKAHSKVSHIDEMADRMHARLQRTDTLAMRRAMHWTHRYTSCVVSKERKKNSEEVFFPSCSH